MATPTTACATARRRGGRDEVDQFVAVSEAIAAAHQIARDVNIGLERDLDVQRNRLVRIENEAEQTELAGVGANCVSHWRRLGRS